MTRNQEIRKEVLLQLYGIRPLPLSPYAILRRAQFDFTEREIKAECEFLKHQAWPLPSKTRPPAKPNTSSPPGASSNKNNPTPIPQPLITDY